MTFSNSSLPIELMLIIGEYSAPRELSLISRSCRALHTLLARELTHRFAADVEGIAKWAAAQCRPITLERAIALAIRPATIIPDRQERLRTHLQDRLAELLQLREADAATVATVRVLLCHGISPNRTRSYCCPESSSKESCMYRAVSNGDLVLARHLLEDQQYCRGGEYCGADEAVGHGRNPLLIFARARRFEVPMGRGVEEMIQLLVDHDPYGGRPWYPGIHPRNQSMVEKMLKCSKNPGAIMDAWLGKEPYKRARR